MVSIIFVFDQRVLFLITGSSFLITGSWVLGLCFLGLRFQNT